MARALRGLLGAALAIALVEAGLRLAFEEHEADRGYWGRDAFVTAEGLPYRHRPDATLRVGRKGSFEHEVRTNALGFRDQREPPRAAGAHRLMLAGSSYAFGLGVPDPADLMHRQLEERLRARHDWPRDIAVYNVSQAGYKMPAIVALVRSVRAEYSPEAVLMIVAPGVFSEQQAADADIVFGYRMDPERLGRGSALDWIRTHSFAVMRLGNPLEGGIDFHRYRFSEEPGLEADRAATARALSELAALRAELGSEGVPLILLPVTDALASAGDLAAIGFNVLAVASEPGWLLGGDAHLSPSGHRGVAREVARRLPSHRRLTQNRR